MHEVVDFIKETESAVMNGEEEANQAFKDYKAYKNGFERGENWKSKIGSSSGNSHLNLKKFSKQQCIIS